MAVTSFCRRAATASAWRWKHSSPGRHSAICVGKSTYARCGIIANVTPAEAGWMDTSRWSSPMQRSRLPDLRRRRRRADALLSGRTLCYHLQHPRREIPITNPRGDATKSVAPSDILLAMKLFAVALALLVLAAPPSSNAGRARASRERTLRPDGPLSRGLDAGADGNHGQAGQGSGQSLEVGVQTPVASPSCGSPNRHRQNKALSSAVQISIVPSEGMAPVDFRAMWPCRPPLASRSSGSRGTSPRRNWTESTGRRWKQPSLPVPIGAR